jgi:uncharacterized membrane protein
MKTILLWTLFLLGFWGIALSVYMTILFLRVQRGREVKCFDSACPIVMKTNYAQSLGFPNTYLAIPFYLGVAVFAALRLNGSAEGWFAPIAAASGLSVLMSVYLIYALLVKLKQP